MKAIIASGYEKATDIGHEKLNLSTMELVGPEEMDASDGYHTFIELYDHRIRLFLTVLDLRERINEEFHPLPKLRPQRLFVQTPNVGKLRRTG